MLFLTLALGFLPGLFFSAHADTVRIDAPRDAVALALAHALEVKRTDPESLPDFRYFWLVYPTDKTSLDLTVNLTSRSSFIEQPDSLAGVVAAVDLAVYYPNESDRSEVRKLLDSITDPFFHVIRSEDQRVKVSVAPYKAQDGKTYNWKWETKTTQVRGFGLHVQGHDQRLTRPNPNNPDQPILLQGPLPGPVSDINLLAALTHSESPILTAPFYISRKALVELDGGFYYDLLGWQGKTHDQVLQLLGGSQARADAADALERAALFFSEVTGDKPRACVFFYGTNTRPSHAIPFLILTEDIRDGNFDPTKSAIYNLLGAKFDVGEAFGVLPNGLQAGWLFDKATGNLAASAPDDVAIDHTVPPPYTARLQPYISCLSCHAQETGYRSFPNHVKTLLGIGNVQSDLSLFQNSAVGDEELDELRNDLRARYGGDLTRVLEQARRDQAYAVFQATGTKYEDATAALLSTYKTYEYSRVYPTEVCRYLGYQVDSNEEAVALFKKLVPPLPVLGIGRFTPENPSILAIKAGIPIPRREFEFIYPDLALRSLSYQPD